MQCITHLYVCFKGNGTNSAGCVTSGIYYHTTRKSNSARRDAKEWHHFHKDRARSNPGRTYEVKLFEPRKCTTVQCRKAGMDIFYLGCGS